MKCKQSKEFGKLLGLLLLVNPLLVVSSVVTKAQEKPPVPNADTGVPRALPAFKSDSIGYICPDQLGDAIDAAINRPQFRHSHWGILIESLSSNSKLPTLTLYNHDAQKYFIPASNAKLLVTAAALHHLGAEFRIRTSVYGTGAGGVKNANNLYIVGRGDPSLTDTQLKQLAQQLKRWGISQIQQLIARDDYFKGPVVNPTWELADVQADYGAPANSLILNQNTATLILRPQTLGQPLKVSWADPLAATQWLVENNSVTAVAPPSVEVIGNLGKSVLQIRGVLPAGAQSETISVAVPDPAGLFLRHFQRALAIEGMTVVQALVASNSQLPAQELASVESPSLANLLIETNQNSNNLYAEAVLRVLGTTNVEVLQATPLQDSAAMGLVAVKATLTELGVNPESYVLNDGSGLSRHNLVSPEAFVQTLRAIAQTPEAAVFRASLPLAGKSGTLQNRFRNTLAQGVLQGKTGTMSGVSALSGYLDGPSYQPLVFSILVNQSDQPAATMRQTIDEIVLLMTHLQRC